MSNTNRREWMIQAGALATAGLAAAPVSAADSGAWFGKPMRWVQLAFVEDDPGRYDPGFWLDYFQRLHADAACLSAGGCVAFYPTKVPLHYRSKFLGNTDPFGEMLAGCRRLGMNVIARIDPHAAHQDVYDTHPDWIAVGADGKPRRHWADPELWVTCALGPYNFEFMTGVIREIMSTYKADGIFANRWAGSGMCWCQHCRENFKAFSGMDLPPASGGSAEVRSRFTEWQKKRLLELYLLWDAEVKKDNPQAAYFPNGYESIHDKVSVPILIADRQARSGYTMPWQNGKFAKDSRSISGMQKPIAGLFSVGLEAPYRWKDSVQSATEIKIWVVDGIAHGFRPWVCKFNAKPLDRRWFKPVEEVFAWHWKNEKYMHNVKPLARVALVSGPRETRDYSSGFYHALVEARIPFETIVDYNFDLARLSQFKVLGLANVVNLSDAQCAQLRAFVEHGGAIVATHETSLADEHGRRRSDFGLAGLFAASYAGNTIERQQNAYIDFEQRNHPLLAGLEDAGRMIHGVKRVEIRTAPGLRAPLMTVPTYPDLPMEEVYERDTRTTIPAVLLHSVGAGRVVYFPWDIDRTFWEVMDPDHGRVLANAVRWAANEEQPLQVQGPGVLDVSLWQQQNSLTAHLVNLSNPMMAKGPFREILPIAPQKVRVSLPEGTRAKTVRFLVSEAKAQWRQTGEWVETTTPAIGLHEVVAIDL